MITFETHVNIRVNESLSDSMLFATSNISFNLSELPSIIFHSRMPSTLQQPLTQVLRQAKTENGSCSKFWLFIDVVNEE